MNNVTFERNILAKKEIVLGQLLAKSGNEMRMHSSDFSILIQSLDMTNSDECVVQILVNCIIDESGWINFSKLPAMLARERATKIEQASPKKGKVSSVGAPIRPWRPSESHQELIQSEEQFKQVMSIRQELQDLIRNYNENHMTKEVFFNNIESAGVTLTSQFSQLVHTNRNSDLLFADVVKSLTTRSSTSTTVDDKPAGGKANLMQSASTSTANQSDQAAMFQSRRRIEWASNKNYSISNDMVHSRRSGPNTPMHDTSVAAVLGPDEESYMTTEGREAALNSNGQTWDSSMNSEQRLVREQVLSFLRQLCDGNMSISSFMQKTHEMGISIPPSIERILNNFETSGHIDFKEIMRDFEKWFENRRVECKVDPSKVKQIKENVREGFVSRGASSIQGVRDLFNQIDADGNGGLSLAEFSDALKSLHFSLKYDEIRALFNDFDANGNGLISCDEFLVGIRGVLTGHRLRSVKALCRHFDVIGENKAVMSDLEEKFNPVVHPDAVSGAKTPREVCSDFTKALSLTLDESTGMTDLSSLEEYFSNLSAAIDEDDEFDRVIQEMLGTDINALPPRPKTHVMKNGVIVQSHAAAQSHGDILGWSERELAVDSAEQGEENKRAFIMSKKYAQNDPTFELNSWAGKGNNEDLYDQQLNEQVSALGSVRGTRRTFARPSENILEWKKASNSEAKSSCQPVSLSQMLQASPEKKSSRPISAVSRVQESKSVAQQTSAASRTSNFQRSCPFGKDDYANSHLAQEETRANPQSLKDFLNK